VGKNVNPTAPQAVRYQGGFWFQAVSAPPILIIIPRFSSSPQSGEVFKRGWNKKYITTGVILRVAFLNPIEYIINMAKLLDWHSFEKRLKDKNILIFSRLDVGRIFGSSSAAASLLLHRYAKKGLITRVKRGLYTFEGVSAVPTLYLANRLYEPSYVSLEFALSYHRVIPETVYEVTSVTTRNTQRFHAIHKIFSYRRIKKEAFTGYAAMRRGAFSFFIADPEKAFVDLAYLKTIRQKDFFERFDNKKINKVKALRYAKLFKNDKLLSFVKNKLQ